MCLSVSFLKSFVTLLRLSHLFSTSSLKRVYWVFLVWFAVDRKGIHVDTHCTDSRWTNMIKVVKAPNILTEDKYLTLDFILWFCVVLSIHVESTATILSGLHKLTFDPCMLVYAAPHLAHNCNENIPAVYFFQFCNYVLGEIYCNVLRCTVFYYNVST